MAERLAKARANNKRDFELSDTIECKECGAVVRRKRITQRYCSKPCSVRAAMRRMRQKSA